MAQPPPPPQGGWIPASMQRGPTPQILIAVIVAIVMAVVFIGFVVSAMAGFSVAGIVPLFFCIPFLFIIVLVLIAVASASGQRRIPPPPPIQGPMVPAGQQGPVALDCPNCGAPPTNVDRFGVATCSYCGTRFLVR